MDAGTPRVIFTGGGTGGHLFPGLAVAQTLRKLRPTVAITFCGTGRPFEREHVERAGFTYLALPACPIPRSLSSLVRFLLDQPRAIWGARRLLARQPTAAVVGLGGYASVPLVRTAWRRRVPVVLLEQNVVPGRATRWLARRGTVVCGAFDESRSFLSPSVRFHLTGNPVREEIAALARWEGIASPASGPHWSHLPAERPATVGVERERPGRMTRHVVHSALRTPHSALTSTPRQVEQGRGAEKKRDGGKHRTLLVLGGSQGARSLNRAVPKALASLEMVARTWHVIHQAGPADSADVARLYQQTPFSFEVAPFLNCMAEVYREADLIVCRAGGTTLAEVACAGVPAVLVPYPHAAGDHQRHNAEWYATHNAARIVADDAEPHRLAQSLKQTLAELIADDSLLRRMAENMQDLARPNATEAVVGVLKETVES